MLRGVHVGDRQVAPAEVEICEAGSLAGELRTYPIGEGQRMVTVDRLGQPLRDAVAENREPPPRVPGQQRGRLAVAQAVRIGRLQRLRIFWCHVSLSAHVILSRGTDRLTPMGPGR